MLEKLECLDKLRGNSQSPRLISDRGAALSLAIMVIAFLAACGF